MGHSRITVIRSLRDLGGAACLGGARARRLPLGPGQRLPLGATLVDGRRVGSITATGNSNSERQRLQHRDIDAFMDLYDEIAPLAYGYALRVTHSEDHARAAI